MGNIDESFILDESEKYILYHEYENTFLHDKVTGEDIDIYNQFHGDPECGVILDDMNCLIGGNVLVIWQRGLLSVINEELLKDIFMIRRKKDYIVEILTDPWSDVSAVWEININNMSLIKKYDFIKYKNMPYQEHVEW